MGGQGFPHIFVINLKRSPTRRQDMSSRLDPLGVPYSFFDGVDGYTLDLGNLPDYDGKKRRRYFGRDLSPGEIGCLLSHRAVYQHMVDHDIPVAIVLEDDVFLAPAFPALIRDIMSMDVAWDMVRFLESKKVYKRSRILADLSAGFKLGRPVTASGGAYGYMLTQKAAKAYLGQMKTNYVPVDTVHSYIWKTGVETLNVIPSPVVPDREISSTIGEARFDKTLGLSAVDRVLYAFTRPLLKVSEMLGKRCAYIASLPRDKETRRRLGRNG